MHLSGSGAFPTSILWTWEESIALWLSSVWKMKTKMSVVGSRLVSIFVVLHCLGKPKLGHHSVFIELHRL